jgi:hypothetical protein
VSPYDPGVRFRSSGDVRRIDVEPVLELVRPLREEWTRLRFDASGRVVNALSGEAEQTLVLIEGRHRQPAARYRVTVPEQSVLAASGDESCLITLHHDDEHRLAFTVSQEHERWSVDVDLHHGSRPRAVLVGRLDLRAVLEADGTPGCLARLVAGLAGGTVTVDLGALEGPSSPLVVAEGHANRFHADGRIDVGASGRRWRVDGQAAVGGRGLGRLVVLLVRRRVRRGVDRRIERFWAGADGWISQLERDVSQLRSSVAQEGGPEAFVHRALWDPTFDPGPPLTG